MALNFKIAPPAPDKTVQPAAVPARTLLLVDDDHTLLLTLRMFFKRYGWHLLEADSVEEALKLWEANEEYIDAVVTDYSFGGTLTGQDLVTAVQLRRPGFRALSSAACGHRSGVHPMSRNGACTTA